MQGLSKITLGVSVIIVAVTGGVLVQRSSSIERNSRIVSCPQDFQESTDDESQHESQFHGMYTEIAKNAMDSYVVRSKLNKDDLFESLARLVVSENHQQMANNLAKQFRESAISGRVSYGEHVSKYIGIHLHTGFVGIVSKDFNLVDSNGQPILDRGVCESVTRRFNTASALSYTEATKALNPDDADFYPRIYACATPRRTGFFHSLFPSNNIYVIRVAYVTNGVDNEHGACNRENVSDVEV